MGHTTSSVESSRQSKTSDITVQPAAPADLDRAAKVLADAFSKDAYAIGLLPSGDTVHKLTKLFKLQLKHTFKYGGHVWLAIDSSNDDLLGVSEWGAPGKNPGFFSQAPELPGYLSIFRTRVLDAAITDMNADRHRPLIPHWYLKAIGTTEKARGRGAGSALIRHRLAEADATGTPAYLEASSNANVPYYENFGFVERSRIPSRGTVETIGMWRPAQH